MRGHPFRRHEGTVKSKQHSQVRLVKSFGIFGLIFLELLFFQHPFESMAAEGFSSDSRELSGPLYKAWLASVRVRPADQKSVRSSGSGVIIAVNASRKYILIVTNSHVLRPEAMEVGFPLDESSDRYQWVPGHLVRNTPERDLAFLVAAIPKNLEYGVIPFATRESLEALPQAAIAIGFPDLRTRPKKSWKVALPHHSDQVLRRHSVGKTYGPREDREVEVKTWDGKKLVPFSSHLPVIIHNADILNGSSGGALVNSRGELLGINTIRSSILTLDQAQQIAGAASMSAERKKKTNEKHDRKIEKSERIPNSIKRDRERAKIEKSRMEQLNEIQRDFDETHKKIKQKNPNREYCSDTNSSCRGIAISSELILNMLRNDPAVVAELKCFESGQAVARPSEGDCRSR